MALPKVLQLAKQKVSNVVVTAFEKAQKTKVGQALLPSQAVAKERRKETFGTESKAVAGALIGGTAIAAIAAGPAVVGAVKAKGALGAVRAVASKALVGPTVPSTIGKTLGTVAGVSAIAAVPTIVPQVLGRTAAASSKTAKTIFEDKPIKEKAKDIGNVLLDNAAPIAAGAALVGGGIAGAVLIDKAIDKIKEKKEELPSPSMPSPVNNLVTLPTNDAMTAIGAPPIGEPMAPPTTTLVTRRKRKKPKSFNNPVTVRVTNNIIGQLNNE